MQTIFCVSVQFCYKELVLRDAGLESDATVLLGVLLRVSIAVITHRYQKQLRGKGFLSSDNSQVVLSH